MQGTSFGNWLQGTYPERLIEIANRAHSVIDANGYHDQKDGDLYGMSYHAKDKHVFIDGACGLSSVMKIAEAIGLQIEQTYERKAGLTGLYITDTRN